MRKITHSYIRNVLEEARDFIPDEALYLSIAQNLLENKYTPSITHSFLEIGHISKVNETFANSDKKDESDKHDNRDEQSEDEWLEENNCIIS